MIPSRIAAALFFAAFFMVPTALSAQDEKPQVTDITPAKLLKDAQKLNDKLLRIEGVVGETPIAVKIDGEPKYALVLGEDADHLMIWCAGTPTVAKGDRVRITGKLMIARSDRIDDRPQLDVKPPHGKVEKLPAKKPGQDQKPEVKDVPVDRLRGIRDEQQRIRIEGVVKTTPAALESGGKFHYRLELDEQMLRDVHIHCEGKPAVVRGDWVRVTGTARVGYGVWLNVFPPHGKVEIVDDAAVLNFFQQRTLSDAQVALAAVIKELSDNDLRKLGLSKLDNRSDRARIIAGARLLARRKPGGAARVFLDYLPAADRDVREVIRQSLAQVALKDGKVDEAVRSAAKDQSALRRAAAADLLTQAGEAERPLALALLQDADVEVRFAAAAGLLRAGVKEAVPVLTETLADAPLGLAYEAEDLLFRLAGAKPPQVPLVRDDPESRKKARATWAAWWQASRARIDLAKLDLDQSGPGFVNLAAHANVRLTESATDPDNKNHLAQLPTGRQTFAGVPFKVGMGLIQLGSANMRGKPTEVEGIKVERRADRLHFLHATHWGDVDGRVIAQYVVRYADLTTCDIDIAYGTDVVEWWASVAGREPTHGKVAWEGENDVIKAPDKIRLYRTTWENPHPEKKIVSLDFVVTAPERPVAPFCVAITAEDR